LRPVNSQSIATNEAFLEIRHQDGDRGSDGKVVLDCGFYVREEGFEFFAPGWIHGQD